MDKIVPKDEEFIYEGKVAISQTDLKGNITFVNRKFCEISGYTVEELVGSNINIVKHPDVPEKTFDKMWMALQSGQVWNGLLKNLRKDGSFYWVDMEIAPIMDENEQITGYISVGKPAPRKNIEDVEKQNSTK
ncbi:MAG: PAS domain-containing protein [Sulfurimonas sp.]|uniref:PAS domain-containing protein n=1 Tax=Sulfurimonas sp. TaxID=2022749 RepID=UPI0026329D76|nr:PAS domain-containing protein [Sulfurimonas sp.]MCW8894654.1 PAS domain-containing protein [Sulfurimonas sp.]MCW8953421.1 PAS domain-containing protein [Sulfurimonas sp.]